MNTVHEIESLLVLTALFAFFMSETLQRIINFIRTVNSRTDEVSNRLSALESRVAQLELFQSTPQIDVTVANNMLSESGQ